MNVGAKSVWHAHCCSHTSCSGLWKCLTRLFAASLMSSCTSTDSIPDKINQDELKIETWGGEVEGGMNRKVIQGAESGIEVSMETSRSAIVLKNARFVSTYCFGCQAIPALSGHSGKERPAPEASLSTFQHPPLHQVTPADQWGLSPSCRRPRLSPAIGHMGTWGGQQTMFLLHSP